MLEVLGRRRVTGVLALLAGMVAWLGIAQAASAAELSRNASNFVVLTDVASETNNIDLVQITNASNPNDKSYYIGDRNQPLTDTNGDSGCTQSVDWIWFCGRTATGPTPPSGYVVNLGNGDDSLIPGQWPTGGTAGCPSSFTCGIPDLPITATGGSGNDTMFGEGNNDSLNGQAGDDTVSGNDGNDVIRGGKGTDDLSGGNGTDTVDYGDRTGTEGVTVSLDGTKNDGQPGELDFVRGDFENIAGGAGNDTLAGNNGVNVINGGDGNDTIRGYKGADNLNGGNGSDIVDYSYLGATEPASVSLDGVNNEPEGDQIHTDFEGIIGGGGNDTLTGDDAANTISGGSGNDTIDPRGGSDTVSGDDGDDNITTTDGVVDTIDCGPGTDTNNADSGDIRTACELPPPPPPPPSGGGGGTGGGGGGGGGGGTTPPPVVLKNFSVTVVFSFLPRHPRKTTTFTDFVANNVPRGSKLVARCVTKKGKKCKGKLGKSSTIKKTTKKTISIKAFRKKYPAGSFLEVTVSKAGFNDQIKIVAVRKNKVPSVNTKCAAPGSTKRHTC